MITKLKLKLIKFIIQPAQNVISKRKLKKTKRIPKRKGSLKRRWLRKKQTTLTLRESQSNNGCYQKDYRKTIGWRKKSKLKDTLFHLPNIMLKLVKTLPRNLFPSQLSSKNGTIKSLTDWPLFWGIVCRTTSWGLSATYSIKMEV